MANAQQARTRLRLLLLSGATVAPDAVPGWVDLVTSDIDDEAELFRLRDSISADLGMLNAIVPLSGSDGQTMVTAYALQTLDAIEAVLLAPIATPDC